MLVKHSRQPIRCEYELAPWNSDSLPSLYTPPGAALSLGGTKPHTGPFLCNSQPLFTHFATQRGHQFGPAQQLPGPSLVGSPSQT